MSARSLARGKILLAALLFSTGGAAVKSVSLTAWQIAAFRSGLAALFLLAFLPAARRRWSAGTLLVGTAYAATMILFVTGNKLTTAANAIFLQATAPLYVLLLSPLLLREKIRRRDLVHMMALAAGLALLFVGVEQPSATAPNPHLGKLVGIGAGIAWALTILGLRWRGRDGEDALSAVVAGNFLAFLIAMPLALPLQSISWSDATIVGYLGVFQIGVAYIFLTGAMGELPAVEASLLLLLEPVFNPVWAWLVHGERPGPWSLAGGMVILAVSVVRTLRGVRTE